MGTTPKKKKKTVKKKKANVSGRKSAVVSNSSRRPLDEIVAEQLAPAQEELDRLIPSADQGDASGGPHDTEPDIEGMTDVSQEGSSIISIIKGFEEQVETAFALKSVLEGKLDATRQKLAREVEIRSELEDQVESLLTRVALVDQLRKDITLVEQERNRFAYELALTKHQLEQVVTERDSFAEQIASAESNVSKRKKVKRKRVRSTSQNA